MVVGVEKCGIQTPATLFAVLDEFVQDPRQVIKDGYGSGILGFDRRSRANRVRLHYIRSF